MNNNEYLILDSIINNQFHNQREIATKNNISLGLVNKTLTSLKKQNIIDNSNNLINQNIIAKNVNAIILAAGPATRLTPISRNISKAFLKINNEVLIERLIKQLKEAGIDNIKIIIGYQKEKFDYLVDKYHVDLIINNKYKDYSNAYSLALAKEELNNTYIIPCDIYLEENIFIRNNVSSWYGLKKTVDQNAYVTLNKKNEVIKTAGEGFETCGGLMFINKISASKYYQILKNNTDYQCYYDDLLFENDKMFIPALFLDGVREFNSYNDVISYDYNSESLENETLNIIKNVFKVGCKDIEKIELLKAGMTNNSFIFTIKNKRYIMRMPGAGTDQLINRHQEKAVYDVISPLNISDKVLYFNPDNGYKITEFIESSHSLDPNNKQELSNCMNLLKKLHTGNLTVKHHFKIFELIDFYEDLMKHHSMYPDYIKTKTNIMKLKKVIDSFDIKNVLCHIDANHDNFIIDNQGNIRLLDFEYAGMQDKDLDIAMFIIYALLDRKGADEVIDIYYEYQCPDKIRYKIYAYMAIAGMLWSNWCEFKYQLGIDFGEYSYRQYRYAKDYFQIIKNETKNIKEFSSLGE